VEGDVDSDSDGFADYLDPDSDTDGIPDSDEGSGDSVELVLGQLTELSNLSIL
jgi:hypothetical protein